MHSGDVTRNTGSTKTDNLNWPVVERAKEKFKSPRRNDGVGLGGRTRMPPLLLGTPGLVTLYAACFTSSQRSPAAYLTQPSIRPPAARLYFSTID